MASDNALLRSVDERLEKFRLQFRACKRDFSEEAVHDLRVAARRLLAALDLGRALAPRPSLQNARRALKSFLDGLDELRDTQVMLIDMAELLAAFPQVEGLVKKLEKREKKLLRAARENLKKATLADIGARVEKSRAALQEHIRPRGFKPSLLRVVDETHETVTRRLGQVEAGQSSTIHRVRVAFKKFRYMVEIAQPLLPAPPETLFEKMHDYQSRMGEVQDADVTLQTLDELAESASPADLAPVRRFLEDRRAERIAACLQAKDEVFTFWRAAPEASFPWEGTNETLHRAPRHRRGSGGSRSRQPAPADREGPPQDAQDRPGPEGTGGDG
jgi:CHAD domain-containing protein